MSIVDDVFKTQKRLIEKIMGAFWYCNDIPIKALNNAQKLLDIENNEKIKFLIECDTPLFSKSTHVAAITEDRFIIAKKQGVLFCIYWCEVHKIRFTNNTIKFINEKHKKLNKELDFSFIWHEKKMGELLTQVLSHIVSRYHFVIEVQEKIHKYEALHKWDGMIEYINENQKLYDKVWVLEFNKGKAYFNKGNAIKALDIFHVVEKEKSLAKDQLIDLKTILGECYIITKDIEKASAYFTEAYNIESDETKKRKLEQQISKMAEEYSKQFVVIPEHNRKLLYITNKWLSPKQDTLKILNINNLPENLKFPIGHPKPNEVYVKHELKSTHYFPIKDFEDYWFTEKVSELIWLLQCLGATEIKIKRSESDSQEKSKESNIKINVEGEAGRVPIARGGVDVNKNLSTSSITFKGISFNTEQRFSPKKAPYIPDDLIWYHQEPMWQGIAKQRLHGEVNTTSITLTTENKDTINERELLDVDIAIKTIATSLKIKYNSEIISERKSRHETVWQIEYTFAPKDELEDVFETATIIANEYKADSIKQSTHAEYREEIEFYLENDGDISEDERRILNRLKTKLNLSDAEAFEIEQDVIGSLGFTEEEMEYLDDVKHCLENDSFISDDERRTLQRRQKKLNITDNRAAELENIALNKL